MEQQPFQRNDESDDQKDQERWIDEGGYLLEGDDETSQSDEQAES